MWLGPMKSSLYREESGIVGRQDNCLYEIIIEACILFYCERVSECQVCEYDANALL